MLTKDSVGKFFTDGEGAEYLCVEEVKTCCAMLHYLLEEFCTPNRYPYSSQGIRLDHKLRHHINSGFNLKS